MIGVQSEKSHSNRTRQEAIRNEMKFKTLIDSEKKYLEKRRELLKEKIKRSQTLFSKMKDLTISNSARDTQWNTMEKSTSRLKENTNEDLNISRFNPNSSIKTSLKINNKKINLDLKKITENLRGHVQNLSKSPNRTIKIPKLIKINPKQDPCLTFYNTTYTTLQPCQNNLSLTHINKFKKKIEIRKICLEEEIYPFIHNTEPDDPYYNRERLFNLVDKPVNVNKLDILGDLYRSGSSKKILKAKKKKKDQLKEYNKKLIHFAKEYQNMSDENLKKLSRKLHENYMLSQVSPVKLDSKWKKVDDKMKLNPNLGYLTNLIKKKFQ